MGELPGAELLLDGAGPVGDGGPDDGSLPGQTGDDGSVGDGRGAVGCSLPLLGGHQAEVGDGAAGRTVSEQGRLEIAV